MLLMSSRASTEAMASLQEALLTNVLRLATSGAGTLLLAAWVFIMD